MTTDSSNTVFAGAFSGASHRPLVAIALGLLGACSSESKPSAEAIHRAYESLNHSGTNILIITADDLGATDVGAYSNGQNSATPNIDRLASAGFRFGRAYVNSSICHPSRNVWMTGYYPSRNGGAAFEPITDDIPTAVEALRSAGYLTGLLGKEDHTLPERPRAWDYVVTDYALQSGRAGSIFASSVAAIADSAYATGRPFLIVANVSDPHRPFPGSDQESQRAGWDDDFRPPPPSFDSDSSLRLREVPGYLPRLPEIETEWVEYLRAVVRMDANVGLILRELESRQLLARTVVFFLSDNGPPFPFAKAGLWDASLRIPWIMVLPTGETGVDEEHFVSGIDLAPTLLEVAGLPGLPGEDGHSVLPVVRGEADPSRNFVYGEVSAIFDKTPFPMRAIRVGRMGYIFNSWVGERQFVGSDSQSGRSWAAMVAAAQSDSAIASRVRFYATRTVEELYDYEADPFALTNLSADPAYAHQMSVLRLRLLDIMVRNGDPLLGKYLAALQ